MYVYIYTLYTPEIPRIVSFHSISMVKRSGRHGNIPLVPFLWFGNHQIDMVTWKRFHAVPTLFNVEIQGRAPFSGCGQRQRDKATKAGASIWSRRFISNTWDASLDAFSPSQEIPWDERTKKIRNKNTKPLWIDAEGIPSGLRPAQIY